MYIVISVILFLLIAQLLRSFYQQKKLHKQMTKAQFALVSERQRQQILNSELTSLREKFDQQILTDPVTSTISRQVFEDRLLQAINQSKRYQLNLAVMQLNIDEFKMVNDVLGQDAGDILLRESAKRLQGCIREMDGLCRLEADHFALLFPQLAKAEAAIYIAQRFLAVMSQPFRIQEQSLFITVSIGVAIYPIDGEEARVLLKCADTALYQAKLMGRNTFQFYQKEMQEHTRRELMLHSALRNPDVYRELTCYFRPLIQVNTNNMVGIDTHVHWRQPVFGLITSKDFFHLAENSGKLLELGEWLFRQVLSTFQQQHQHLQQILIPISLRQLESSHFIYKISQFLQELRFNPEHLVLEISENTLPSKMDAIEKAFNMLKHLGVKIAVANFGAGHLSLLCLEKLPIDYLKIDQSLIDKITTHTQTEAIVKMVIAIAKNLKITLIAEGVTTEAQKTLLQQWGCNIMQGELFGPLMLAEELMTQ